MSGDPVGLHGRSGVVTSRKGVTSPSTRSPRTRLLWSPSVSTDREVTLSQRSEKEKSVFTSCSVGTTETPNQVAYYTTPQKGVQSSGWWSRSRGSFLEVTVGLSYYLRSTFPSNPVGQFGTGVPFVDWSVTLSLCFLFRDASVQTNPSSLVIRTLSLGLSWVCFDDCSYPKEPHPPLL